MAKVKGPSLWKGATFSDGKSYAATIKISSLQNTVIDRIQRGVNTRNSLSESTGVSYDSICRHVRLLIEDGVLSERDNGELMIAPLETHGAN
jgi:hypothetical protein